MKPKYFYMLVILALAALDLGACLPAQDSAPGDSGALKVLAVETFLADIAQNVAGERAHVESLIPLGLDPHAFSPTPQDVRKIAESNVLILNGAGFEEWAQETLDNAGGRRLVIEASAGLTSRAAREGEQALISPQEHASGDPHFWLDPSLVIRYVENIRDGLSGADPQGAPLYARNAADYIARLIELDGWIKSQVAQIPPGRRLIVTNHESFGYFADRYGFTIIGTIIPSVSSGVSPSALQLARLIDQVKKTGATAIFIESGASSQLASQVSAETGVKVVDQLYSHSISEAGGPAPTYVEMMKYNVTAIVNALK